MAAHRAVQACARAAACAATSRVASNAPRSIAEQYLLRPVGALTSKPYAFQGRPWELKSTESIDIFDGVGSNIRIDTRGEEILRILPRLNENVNEEWISDKSRFAYDGLKRQRLSTPMARNKEGDLVPVTWDRARSLLLHFLLELERNNPNGYEAHAVLGPYVDIESAVALRSQFYRWFPEGQIHVQERPNMSIPIDFRHSYTMNTTIPGLEEADAVLLVGADPRKEAPLVNTRIRKAVMYRHIPVASVGCVADLTYPVQHIGSSPRALASVVDGSHPFANVLAAAEKPAILVSNAALKRQDGAAIFEMVEDIVRNCAAVGRATTNDGRPWDGLAVLQSAANTVGLLDIGFDDKNFTSTALAHGTWSKTKFLYLLGADDIDNLDVPEDAVVVYQGHHGDRGAADATIVLPGAAYTEKNATYVNTEGRVQRTKLAFFPPGIARQDNEILRDIVGTDSDLESAEGLMNSMPVELLAPHLVSENHLQPADRPLGADSVLPDPAAGPEVSPTPFQPPVENFYMTDPITRCSKTMAKCSRVRQTSNFA